MSFALIFATVIAIGISSAAQFKAISIRKADLTDRAIPLLTGAQELGVLLSYQSDQTVALRDLDLFADVDEASENFRRRQDEFTTSILSFLSASGRPELSGLVSQYFTSTNDLIDVLNQRRDLGLIQEAQLQELRETVDRIEVQVEGLWLDVLTQLQSDVDVIDVDPSASDRIVPLSIRLNSLILLGLRTEKMQDLAEQSTGDRSLANAGEVAEELNFNLREILGQMTRLSDIDQQRALTSQLVAARTIISGPKGILANAELQDGLEREIERTAAASLANIDQIEAEIASTIVEANEGAQTTSQLLDQSIRAVSTSNLLMIVVFAGGFVLVILVLVELQFNRRIKSLIVSVREMGRGHYDGDIAVQGGDELGEVADALRKTQRISRDLARSNADLQSFAYAASHDLKTPLRAITDLATWTLEDARDELSPGNIEKLELLSNRSERLSRLLDGLLLYAQVEGMVIETEVFDLAGEAAAISDLIDPHGRFSVLVDPQIPRFSTAVVPLRQILNNLISNAVKHHDKPTGTIWIGANLTQTHVEITVEDDGPGISEEYHMRIFELFQKLESRDLVEGAGIGLALVKKLAERHGGDVTVESDPETKRGTKFRIRFAAQPC